MPLVVIDALSPSPAFRAYNGDVDQVGLAELARWNEVDLSQVAPSPVAFGPVPAQPQAGSGLVSLVSPAKYNPTAIRVEATGFQGLFAQRIFPAGLLPRRFRLRYRLRSPTAVGLNGNHFTGFAIGNQLTGTSFRALGLLTSFNSSGMTLRGLDSSLAAGWAGVGTLLGNAPTATFQVGSIYDLEYVSPTISPAAGGHVFIAGLRTLGDAGSAQAAGSDATGSVSTGLATWGAQTLDTLYFVINSSLGGMNIAVDFDMIQVLRHPMDV